MRLNRVLDLLLLLDGGDEKMALLSSTRLVNDAKAEASR